ncbi:MAG: tRNA (adenosine(37)-N6)-threonylcarbamoyltransferase complex dimerization subunit type 1 TsaB [Flavisolibacter sp.]
MSLLLHIDSAVESASVCLSDDDRVVQVMVNEVTKDHASWLHPSIQELLQNNNRTFSELSAISISKGPGSYTGLRVGMAAAKGLCFALNIPLITINTLKLMASAAKDESNRLLCPMIDARRMEVFTAVYDQELRELAAPSNLVLTANSFQSILEREPIVFFGNGSTKFRQLTQNSRAFFKESRFTAADMVDLAYSSFLKGEFANLAYSEPFYGKEFYSTLP